MRFIYSKAFSIFAFCLVILAIIVFLQVKGLAEPVRAVFLQTPRPVVYAFGRVLAPVKIFFTTIYRLKQISRENSDLRGQIFSLQDQLAGYDQARRENDSLRKELGFLQEAKTAYQACAVLAQNPLNLTDTLVLNCGSAAGVAEGQAVVSQGYLVGKIIYAGKTSSTALLITSSKFSSDAKLSRTGVSGVVHGSFGSGVILDQLPQTEAADQGWLAVTAGINGKIPKNILIGQVGETLSSQNDLFKQVTLVSPVDYGNLQFVFIPEQ